MFQDSNLYSESLGQLVAYYRQPNQGLRCASSFPVEADTEFSDDKSNSVHSSVKWYDDRKSLTFQQDPGHVHEDGAVYICSDFIRGQCRNGPRCVKHHCPLPYQWQSRDKANAKKWRSFSEAANKQEEKRYCTLTVYSGLMLQGSNLLDTMESDEFRRLSTESYVKNPDNPFATTWTWYWQDDTKIWEAFGDGPKNAVQQQIEIAFLDLTTQWHEYSSPPHTYRLYFREKPMYQKNMGTGTKRTILRKPEFRPNVQQLKSSQGQMQFQGPGSNRDPGLPSYWTQMPQGKDFICVPLSADLGEYKKVENRFRETMPQETKLDKVKRVQNPYMWKKFNRSNLLDTMESDEFRRLSTESYVKNPDPGLPSYWTQMPQGKDFICVALSADLGEYKKVENRFRETMPQETKLDKVKRVQNPYMWKKFNSKRDEMKKRSSSVLEKDLFHGTDPNAAENICKKNFDWRRSGKHGTLYGHGSYFALNASYSHSYSKNAGNHVMFLANVLVGSYVQGDPNMRLPPLKNPSDPNSDQYDSCVNSKNNPEIFVVFEIDQCYPSYIIEYTVSSPACHSAVRRRPVGASTSGNPIATVARASSPGYTSTWTPASQTSYASSHSGARISQAYGAAVPQRPVVASTSGNPTATVAQASSPAYTSTWTPASQTSNASSHSGARARARASSTSFSSSNTSISAVYKSAGYSRFGNQTTKRRSRCGCCVIF